MSFGIVVDSKTLRNVRPTASVVRGRLTIRSPIFGSAPLYFCSVMRVERAATGNVSSRWAMTADNGAGVA